MESTLEVAVWRGTADGDYQTFHVPHREHQTVLDTVTYIQRHLDSTLAYRFACRVGMCGSCAMTVNGRPRWTCRTHVQRVVQSGRVEIAPLRNLPVIKDLVCDMAPFFDKWVAAGGTFVAPDSRPSDFALVAPDSRKRQLADAGTECIGCGVCYAACDIVGWKPEYLGPAALNRAWTLVNDVRDAGNHERLAAVSGDAGCHSCHSQQSCTERCPMELDPAASIAGLKRSTLRALFGGRP